MTSPGQALIGRRSQQVGCGLAPAPPANSEGPGPHRPLHPALHGLAQGNVRLVRHLTPEVKVEKCEAVPAQVPRAKEPSSLRASGSRAGVPLCGRPTSTAERRGVRARGGARRGGAGLCVGRARALPLPRLPAHRCSCVLRLPPRGAEGTEY